MHEGARSAVPGTPTRGWTARGTRYVYRAHRASALRVLDRIRVPALILTAEDDPFVPVAPFRDPAVTNNPQVRVVITPYGGQTLPLMSS